MTRQQHLKRCALVGVLAFGLLGVTTASIANSVSIGRYLSVKVKPQADQERLLQQRLYAKFPQNILTLKQAIDFLLQFSGYRLVASQQMSQPVRDMLRQALPEVDKTFGPMTLIQSLETLVGAPFCVLIDPINRLVGFKVKPSYQHLYKRSVIQTHSSRQHTHKKDQHHDNKT